MEVKRKLIDLDGSSVIKLTVLALKDDSDLKNFCQKVLKEVGDSGAYNSSLVKTLKLMVIDTERCNCVAPQICELCNPESAYNVFKKKIINLVAELEQRNDNRTISTTPTDIP